MVPSWHLLVDLDGRPGWQNMAIDQALLERASAGERWLRLYRWSPHCLSFGRHEPALRRYDRTRIEERRLEVVRRPSGGRAVWHAEELTYAVAAPVEVLGGLRQAYEEIHRMLLAAMRLMGVRAVMAPTSRAHRVDAGACFASSVGGEITFGGRKLVGSAQVRENGGLLQHGSLLLAGRQLVVQELTRGDGPPDLAGALAEVTGRQPDVRSVAEAVAAAAADRWPGHWIPATPTDDFLARAVGHEVRFRSPAWTWRA